MVIGLPSIHKQFQWFLRSHMPATFRFGQRIPPPFSDEPPLTVSTNDIGRSVGCSREEWMDAPPEPDPDPDQIDDDDQPPAGGAPSGMIGPPRGPAFHPV
jgi:hypothetical protein